MYKKFSATLDYDFCYSFRFSGLPIYLSIPKYCSHAYIRTRTSPSIFRTSEWSTLYAQRLATNNIFPSRVIIEFFLWVALTQHHGDASLSRFRRPCALEHRRFPSLGSNGLDFSSQPALIFLLPRRSSLFCSRSRRIYSCNVTQANVSRYEVSQARPSLSKVT